MIYIVNRRSDGREVHRYAAAGVVEGDYPIDKYTHTLTDVSLPPASSGERNISGVQYLRRFTQDERIAIREAAKQSAILDDYLKLLDATIAQGGLVNLNDPDTVGAVTLLEQSGLIAAGRAEEILNG